MDKRTKEYLYDNVELIKFNKYKYNIDENILKDLYYKKKVKNIIILRSNLENILKL